MALDKLKYLSEATLAQLRSNIVKNYERYTDGDFLELAAENGWSIDLAMQFDPCQLKKLDPAVGAGPEVKNSILVWNALGGLSPALATEERIWVRLSHLECLEFSRKRWLKSSGKEATIDAIRRHLFAGTVTSIRDDHSVARLWWNAYVGYLAMPDDHERALKVMLSKADIRSNLIERTRTISRPQLAAAILRAMISDPRIAETEVGFRTFMKTLNRLGGGELFEVMPAAEIDRFILECASRARAEAAS